MMMNNKVDDLNSDGNFTSTSRSIFNATNGTLMRPFSYTPAHLQFHIIVRAFYVLVTCLGLLGNCMVCYLFAARKVKYTTFNLQLLNLAISDILADISVYSYVFLGWELSALRKMSSENANIACAFTIAGLLPYWMATAVSVLLLAFISLSRYLKIKYPTKGYWLTSKQGTITIVILIWLLCMILSVPHLLSFVYDPRTARCNRSWPKGFNGQVYRFSTALISIALPTVMMLFTFISAAHRLWGRQKNISNSEHVLVKRRNTVRHLGLLILVYLVFTTPFFIYWFIAGIIPYIRKNTNLERKLISTLILVALCNTVANPVVYAMRAEDFRKGVQEIRQNISRSLGRLVTSKKDQTMSSANASHRQGVGDKKVSRI